jgi:hypothetical protein
MDEATGQATDDNMAHAHCFLDTEVYRHTHSVCVMPIAFPQQQRLHERALMLRYSYSVGLVYLFKRESTRIYPILLHLIDEEITL